MVLTGNFKVTGIKKKTQAKFFKDLQVGDEFTLNYNLNGGYGYSPSISIYQEGIYKHSNSVVQLSNNIDNFEVEQVEM